MGAERTMVWLVAAATAMVLVAGADMAPAADQQTIEALQRELEEMKRRLAEIEALTRQQQEMIRRLSGGQPPPAATPPPVPTELEQVQKQLKEQADINRRQAETNRKQEETIRRLTAGRTPSAPSTPPVGTAAAPPPVASTTPTADKPREPWSPAQPITLLSGSRSYLNISFDALMDFGWSTTSDVTAIETGDHDPLQRGFTLPNEEIFFDGAVDPYFKGVADLVFKLDENNETEVELEEVYLMTTSLPWNLQAKGGQFFSEFGRINQQHPHAWDFVDQPLVIGRMFGPEGLRNPGARLSWLLPTPFYSELFVAAQNSNGGTAFSFRNTDDTFFGRTPVDRPVANPGDLLYVPRFVASFEPTDSQTILAGVSGAFGPNASGTDTNTQIYGGDLYWKWKPAWQSGGFPFVAWQTELLGRRFEAGPVSGAQPLPSQTLSDWGFYSQLLYGFTQRWVAGMRVDWVSNDEKGLPPADSIASRFRWSPNLTFYPTEFSKLRLQYNYDHGQTIPNGDDSSVWLQVEFLLGSHAAHKSRRNQPEACPCYNYNDISVRPWSPSLFSRRWVTPRTSSGLWRQRPTSPRSPAP